MTFLIDQVLAPYCAVSSITVAGGTVASALKEVFNRYPQLYVYLLDNNAANASRFALVLNDDEVLELSDLHRLVPDTATLALVEVVPYGQDAYSLGSALIDMAAEYGVISASTWAAAGVVTATIIGSVVITGMMLALNMVMGALSGDLAMPDINSGSLGNSATYSFTGITNTTATGTPIQVVYGQHRTGGHVLALFTESTDTDTVSALTATSITTDTFLFYQLGMSEGEITGISDVEINKLPYTFFSAVDVSNIRYGTATQEPMLEFDKVMTTTTVSRKVMAIPDINLINPPIVFASYQTMYGILELTDWGKTKTYKPGLYKLQYNYYEDAYYDYGGGA